MSDTATEPGSEEELAALIRAADAAAEPLLIEGNGSKRHHGPATPAGCRRVSLRRLGGVTAYAPGDLVVSVRAGTRLADLQRTLAEHRQWLPLDSPYAGATVGGILATGSAGPRRLGYGTIKDALLGLRLMGPEGVITRSGGRVVKNVTGFDLHRLQLGAFGTLGIILEAHLKVASRPAVAAAWLAPQPTLAAALRWLLAVQASALRPVALEALDAGALEGCRALVPETPAAPALALVGIEGTAAVVERHLRDLRAVAAEGSSGRALLLEGSATDRLWQAFRDAPARATDQVTLRLGARPHDLPALLEHAGLGGCGLVGASGHAGNGIARLRFARPADGAAWIAQPALATLSAAARACGGYLVAESAPLDLPGRAALPWTAGAAAEMLARRIRQAWDPRSLLNPGRALP